MMILGFPSVARADDDTLVSRLFKQCVNENRSTSSNLERVIDTCHKNTMRVYMDDIRDKFTDKTYQDCITDRYFEDDVANVAESKFTCASYTLCIDLKTEDRFDVSTSTFNSDDAGRDAQYCANFSKVLLKTAQQYCQRRVLIVLRDRHPYPYPSSPLIGLVRGIPWKSFT